MSNLKMNHSIKIIEIEDKLKKINCDIDIYKKNAIDLKKEIEELKVR